MGFFGEDFLKNVTEKVNNTANNIAQSASSYISDNAGNALLAVVDAPQGGNQSAADLAAGKTGSPPQALRPNGNQNPTLTARANDSGAISLPMFGGMSVGVIAAILIGAYFVLGRK